VITYLRSSCRARPCALRTALRGSCSGKCLPFGVMGLVLSGIALGPRTRTLERRPGLFYLVMLLVTLLMINRSQANRGLFGHEASVATLGLDPAGVFLGKALALAVELWITGVVLLAGAVYSSCTPPSWGRCRRCRAWVLILAALAGRGHALRRAEWGWSGPATLLADLGPAGLCAPAHRRRTIL